MMCIFLNTHLIDKMNYHSTFPFNPMIFEDVFSGSHYWQLLSEFVVIDGVHLHHKFFSDPHDMALGILTDGFQIFKWGHKGSPTCWPLIALNFNLPPAKCVHLHNIIPITIIPGPKSPQHMSSFLHPFINDCKQLTVGVHTYDVQHDECSNLHVYPISAHADMPTAK